MKKVISRIEKLICRPSLNKSKIKEAMNLKKGIFNNNYMPACFSNNTLKKNLDQGTKNRIRTDKMTKSTKSGMVVNSDQNKYK
jgi:hypothetical protein